MKQQPALVIGALFVIAVVASIVGGTIIASVISSSGQSAVLESRSQLLVGVLLELVNAISVAAIGILMYPILRAQDERMSRSYLCFRVTEAVFCCAMAIIPLVLMQLWAGTSATQDIKSLVSTLIAVRARMGNLLIPVLFCLGAALFYGLLYRSGLLPRFISVWGMIAVVLVFAANMVGLFRTDMNPLQMFLACPIIINEIFLGIWLVVKGFNPQTKMASAIAAQA